MDRKKLLKLINVFFVLFILSGIGSIVDFYYGRYPGMFVNLTQPYEFFKLGHVNVIIPGVPFFLVIVTVAVFLYLIKKLHGIIVIEIKKENQDR